MPVSWDETIIINYQSYVTDAEWELIKVSVKNYGNRRKHEIRLLVNAGFYLVKSDFQNGRFQKVFLPYSFTNFLGGVTFIAAENFTTTSEE